MYASVLTRLIRRQRNLICLPFKRIRRCSEKKGCCVPTKNTLFPICNFYSILFCLQPNRSEYAISFTYNVKCAMTSSSEGSAQQEVEVAEIAGSLEGLLPAALPAAIMTEVGDSDSSTTMRSLIMAT